MKKKSLASMPSLRYTCFIHVSPKLPQHVAEKELSQGTKKVTLLPRRTLYAKLTNGGQVLSKSTNHSATMYTSKRI